MTREEAVDTLVELWVQSRDLCQFGRLLDAIEAMEMAIEALSQPERKKGRWIDITNNESLDMEYKCSKCGWKLFLWSDLTNFCPNCGADMRERNNK